MKLVLTLIFALSILSSFAQEPSKKEKSKELLNRLENGYLLVQLFTRERTKQHIEKELGPEAVNRYEADQQEKRKKLMKAFEQHFSFCPVLFFFSNDAEKIKQKNFSELTLYNSSFGEVSGQVLETKSFLIGEVSRVESDSITYVANDGSISKRPSYAFSAFVMRDDQFRQLTPPFPFYVRTMQGMPFFQRKENGLVKALQNKLERFKKRMK
jgi:hypothetical protein